MASARSSAAASKVRSSGAITQISPHGPGKSRTRWSAKGFSLATALRRSPGTRRDTFEAWYGIAGIGAVYHTLNPRLFPDQIAYIANHAEDRALFFDISFAKLVEQIAPEIPSIRLYVALTDRAHLPAIDIPNLVAYEDFIAVARKDFPWKEFDEKTACGLCYTSGTTGNPKGVLYSHRSNVIHALVMLQADVQGARNTDAILPV